MIPDNAAPLANHLWQSTVFGGAVWLITLAFRKNRAAVRHGLWLVASVKFLVPFAALSGLGNGLQGRLSVPATPRVSALIWTFSQPFGAAATATPIVAASSAAARSLIAALLYVWITGSLVSIVWWAVRWLELRRTMAEGAPVNLDIPIRVREHHRRLEPGIFGIFKPVLLLPKGIAERLSPEQIQAVLAHELCHVRRRDNLTAAIHMFVEVLFWFHPLVWWIELRLIDEQERACDEDVLRRGGDPQIYAESILKICECYLTAPSLCVSGITSSNLKKRIEEIMKNRDVPGLSVSKSILLAVAAIAVVSGPIIIGSARAVAAQGSPRGAGESVELPGYRIIAIDIRGQKAISTDVIRADLGLVPYQLYDESLLRVGFENLKRRYGNLGYANFLPQPVFDVDERRKFVTVAINIDEGLQYSVNRIRFIGNTKTPDEVLRREFLVKEGAIFNLALLEASLAKLNQLGIFEAIRIEDAQIDTSPNEPKLDISLRVKEKTR